MHKKIKVLIFSSSCLLVALLICIFALSSCSVESKLKQASKNLSLYEMDLVFNDDTKSLFGSQNVEYVNNSNANLNQVLFHLHCNAFREGAKFKPVSDLNKENAFPNGESFGSIVIKNVAVNNKSVEFSVGGRDENILVVPLSATLYPNSKVEIKMDYDIIVPNIKHRFGYTENAVNLGNFYPVACVYKDDAFDTSPYSFNGDPFFVDIANYKVNFTCDDDFVVASSGNLEKTKQNEGKKCYSFEALGIRDFALSISKKFQTKSTKVGSTQIGYFYYNDTKPDESLDVAKKSVEFFNKSFGKYPFDTLNVVETGFVHGGMEFSNIVFISDELADYEEYTNVVVHEIAHQWWYGIVGDNQNKDGYIDEGLAEYSCILFYENHPEFKKTRQEIIGNDLKSYLLFVDVYGDLFDNFDTSMDRNLVDYTTEPEYTYMAYVKSTLMFDNLRQLVGDDSFLRGLALFCKQNYLCFADKENLVVAFEETSKMPLKAFFDSWIDGKIVIAS